MTKIETADFMLRASELAYNMSVWEDDDGFCTRITVERGDLPVGIVIHHGADEAYSGKIPPLFVGGQATVGEMLAESERHRHDLKWFKKAEAMRASSTLFQDALTADEQARLLIKGRSSFGPEQTVQRNAANVSHQTTQRNWWAERSRITKSTKHYRTQGVRG